MVAGLVAIRQRVGVRVVEQAVVSISPGEFLQGDAKVFTFTLKSGLYSCVCGPNDAGNLLKFTGQQAGAETHLGAETQVRIRHKLWRLVRTCLTLHVGVEPAHGDPRYGQHEAQCPPGFCCVCEKNTTSETA